MRFGECLRLYFDRREEHIQSPRGIEYKLVVTEPNGGKPTELDASLSLEANDLESRPSDYLLKTSPSDLEAPSNDKLDSQSLKLQVPSHA